MHSRTTMPGTIHLPHLPMLRSEGSWVRATYSFPWSPPSRSAGTGRVPLGHSPGRCSTRRSGSWHSFLPTLPPLLLPVQDQRLFSEYICGHIPFSSPNLSVPIAFLELCHISLRLTRKAALTVFYLQKWELACCLELGEKTSRTEKISWEKTRGISQTRVLFAVSRLNNIRSNIKLLQ